MNIPKQLNRGQTAVMFLVVITALIGVVGLGSDVAVLYFNWVQLQKGVDAAALAGAGYLPDDPAAASATARTYARNNGIGSSELVGAPIISSNDKEITVSAKRTVPYFFFRAVGLFSGDVAATATARAPYATSTVGGGNGTTGNPSGNGGSGEDSNGAPFYGSSVGQFGLVPIGLDYTTPYTADQSVTLNYEQVGPGNWGSLALGGTGGNNLRNNIANGFSGPISIGDWVGTEPGQKVGPVDQGFNDRIAAAEANYPNGTFSSHDPANPRVLIVPMVDWTDPNGRNAVQVKAFAALWLDSVSGGTIQAHFIEQVAYNSPPDPNAPFRGAKGRPILIK